MIFLQYLGNLVGFSKTQGSWESGIQGLQTPGIGEGWDLGIAPSWERGNHSRPPNRMLHLSSTGRSRESKVSVLRFHSHPCNVLSRWPSTPERLIPADDIPQNMQSVSLSLYRRRGDLGQPTGIHPIHSQVHNCQHHTRFVK